MAEPARDEVPEPGAQWADQVDKLPKRITTHAFAKKLIELGIIRRGDFVRRIVIDAEVGDAVRIYVERFGDERLLNVATELGGVQVFTTEDLHAKEKQEVAAKLTSLGLDPDEVVRWVMRRQAEGG